MRIGFCSDGFCLYDPKNPSKVKALKLFTKKIAREYYCYLLSVLEEDGDFEKANNIAQFINYLLNNEVKETVITDD